MRRFRVDQAEPRRPRRPKRHVFPGGWGGGVRGEQWLISRGDITGN